MNFYSVGSNFSHDSVGIYRADNRWFLTGFGAEHHPKPHDLFVRYDTDSEVFDMFVEELLELTEHTAHPQLLFRTVDDIAAFLELTDRRLISLQKYVTRVRQHKNLFVCTVEEVKQLVRKPEPTSGEYWFEALMDVKIQTDETIFPPLTFIAAPMFYTAIGDESVHYSDKTVDLVFDRFLRQSHAVFAAVTSQHPEGVHIEAGQLIQDHLLATGAEEPESFVFLPDDSNSHPRILLAPYDMNKVSQAGVAVPITKMFSN